MDDRLSCLVQCHLFLILLVGHTLQQSLLVRNSAEDILARYLRLLSCVGVIEFIQRTLCLCASVVMFVVLSILVAVVAAHVIVFIRKYFGHLQRKRAFSQAVQVTVNPLRPADLIARKDSVDGTS